MTSQNAALFLPIIIITDKAKILMVDTICCCQVVCRSARFGGRNVPSLHVPNRDNRYR